MGSMPPEQVQAHLLTQAFTVAVADLAYIQLIQMGFESYTQEQIVALVQWHMQVVPSPWEPPDFYVSAIVDHVLNGVIAPTE